MLADQVVGINSNAEDDHGDFPAPAKRKSMLTKTFRAIGKVKPKFKSGKSRNAKMQLFDSCSSLDFELGEDSDEEEEENEDVEEKEAIHEEEEQEEVIVHQQAGESVTEKPENISKPSASSRNSKESDGEGQGESLPAAPGTAAGLVSPRPRKPKSEPSLVSPNPRKPSSSKRSGNFRSPLPKKNMASPRPKNKVSSVQKKGSGTPYLKKSTASYQHRKPTSIPNLNSTETFTKTKDLVSANLPTKSLMHTSAVELSLQSAVGSPRPSSNSLDTSTTSIGLPDNVPEECVGDAAGESEQSLKRLSLAFGDDMGGYFAKLQNMKQKEPTDSETKNTGRDKTYHVSGSRTSARLVLNTGDEEVSLPNSVHIELGSGKTLKNSAIAAENPQQQAAEKEQHEKKKNEPAAKTTEKHSTFKTPKPIKRFFSLARSSSKASDKESPKEKKKESTKALSDSSNPSQEEAAKLMERLSSMLSPTTREEPKQSDFSRHIRIAVPSIDDSPTKEFPEIPTERKTSLSDIRRMMDVARAETTGGSSGASTITHDTTLGQRSGRRTNRRDPHRLSNESGTTKEQTTEPSPPSVTPGPHLDEQQLTPTSLRKRRAAARHQNTKTKIAEESEVRPRLPSRSLSLTDVRRGGSGDSEGDGPVILSPKRRQRSRVSSRRVPSESASVVSEVTSSSKASEEPSDNSGSDSQGGEKQTAHSSMRRRRGPRWTSDGSTSRPSINGPIPEDTALDQTDEHELSPPPEEIPSTPTLRSRRFHRRSSESAASSIAVQGNQSDNSLNHRPLDHDDENDESTGVSSTTTQTPFVSRRTRPNYRKTRTTSDNSSSEHGSQVSFRPQNVRSNSTGNLIKTRDLVASSRKPHSGRLLRSLEAPIEDTTTSEGGKDAKEGDKKKADSDEDQTPRDESKEEGTWSRRPKARSSSPGSLDKAKARSSSPGNLDKAKARSSSPGSLNKVGNTSLSPKRPSSGRQLRKSEAPDEPKIAVAGGKDTKEDGKNIADHGEDKTSRDESKSEGTSSRRPKARSSSPGSLSKVSDTSASTRKQPSGRQSRKPETHVENLGAGEGAKDQEDEDKEKADQEKVDTPEDEHTDEAKDEAGDLPGKNIEKRANASESKCKGNNPSLALSLERGNDMQSQLFDDGQYSVSTATTEGSDMFVKGKVSYSLIQSSENLSAPQLIIGPQETNGDSLGVKNESKSEGTSWGRPKTRSSSPGSLSKVSDTSASTRKQPSGRQSRKPETHVENLGAGEGAKDQEDEGKEKADQEKVDTPEDEHTDEAKDEVGDLPGKKIEKRANASESKRKGNNPSLALSLERGNDLQSQLFDDGQCSVSTETTDGSEMFVKGKVSYSLIQSSENLSAPQFIIGPQETNGDSLGVQDA